MIKLFLITLLCVAVLADSPTDKINEMIQKGQEMAKETMDSIMNQGSPLVRRAAQGQGQGQGGPPGQGGPQGGPQGGQGGQGGQYT